MTKRQSSRIRFSPDRVEQAIKASGLKKSELFLEKEADPPNGQMLRRTYRRNKAERQIKPDNLEWLAERLNVAYAYLAGELDWPLGESDESEALDEPWRSLYIEHLLDPERFPYRGWYQLRSEVDYDGYEKSLFEVHGIEHSRLSNLSSKEQMMLLSDIDIAVCAKLAKEFPECVSIDYRDIYRLYDLNDIIDALVEYLPEKSEYDSISDFEDAEQDDPFFSKHVPGKVKRFLWGYGYALDVLIEGAQATEWQAEALFGLLNKWGEVEASAKEALNAIERGSGIPAGKCSHDDLYWLVRPKALQVPRDCSEGLHRVALVCDCRMEKERVLRISFANEKIDEVGLL